MPILSSTVVYSTANHTDFSTSNLQVRSRGVHLRDVKGDKHQNGEFASQTSHPADLHIPPAIQHPLAQPRHDAWPVGPRRRHHQMLKPYTSVPNKTHTAGRYKPETQFTSKTHEGLKQPSTSSNNPRQKIRYPAGLPDCGSSCGGGRVHKGTRRGRDGSWHRHSPGRASALCIMSPRLTNPALPPSRL
jgi:hypothetical protein